MLDFGQLSTFSHVVLVVFLCVWLVSFCSIMAAFHALSKMKVRTNQVVMLLLLNTTEFIFAFTLPLRLIVYFTEQCTACDYVQKVEIWNGFCYYSSFFLITIDRFLCLILNIRYNVIITPKRIKIAVCIVVACCFLFSSPFFFLSSEQSQFVVNSIMYPTIDSLFVVTATTVYTTIIVKLHRKRVSVNLPQQQQRQQQPDRRRRSSFDWSAFRRRYKIPMMIIISFVIFIQIPDFYIILTVYLTTLDDTSLETKYSTSLIIFSCWFLGFFFDSIIYIRLVAKRQRRTNTIVLSA